MSPITKAIDECKFRIPRQILQQVFANKNYHWRDKPITIDEAIAVAVVRQRVLVDCNLVGGVEVFITLDNLPIDKPDLYSSVIHIPKQYTQGRSIISALSIGVTSAAMLNTNYGLSNVKPCSVTPLLQNAMNVMDAMGDVPMVSSARVSLIGENTILVRDNAPLSPGSTLRCIIANDEHMNHIPLRAHLAFSKLVELAVKSYVYNEYVITLDQGQLAGGQELGRFKDIVDGYADSEELYQTFLTTNWSKVAFMSDPERYRRHLSMIVGGSS